MSFQTPTVNLATKSKLDALFPGCLARQTKPLRAQDKSAATRLEPPAMITRFITEVNTRFNPFSVQSRATRLFLSNLPANARAMGMQINTTLLARTSTEPTTLSVKFKDGKEMKLDAESLGINGIIEEVDRHSRALQKQADLADG